MISPLTRTAPATIAPLATVVAMVVALLGVVIAPATAGAQAAGPTMRVSSHALADEASFVASVAFDVADAELGALSAMLSYDPSVLRFVSCTPSDTAVCNEIDGDVHFAGFDVDGFVSDDHFVDVEFVVLQRAATALELTIVTTADVLGTEMDPVAAISGDVTFAATTSGAINGEVVDANNVGVFGAEVCAISNDGPQACTTTNGLGAFEIDQLAAGPHTLVISDPSGVLSTTTQLVDVADGAVTTGVSVTLVVGAPEVEAQAPVGLLPGLDAPDGAQEAAEAPTAEAGQIIVQVAAVDGGFAVFGAEVCATMPVIGTQACGFSDAAGVVQLSGLAAGNYELTALDPAGRFDPAPSTFVGLNPGQGINAALGLPGRGLGEVPEVLAFVDPSPRSEATGLALTGLGLAALTVAGLARRRSSSDDVVGCS